MRYLVLMLILLTTNVSAKEIIGKSTIAINDLEQETFDYLKQHGVYFATKNASEQSAFIISASELGAISHNIVSMSKDIKNVEVVDYSYRACQPHESNHSHCIDTVVKITFDENMAKNLNRLHYSRAQFRVAQPSLDDQKKNKHRFDRKGGFGLDLIPSTTYSRLFIYQEKKDVLPLDLPYEQQKDTSIYYSIHQDTLPTLKKGQVLATVTFKEGAPNSKEIGYYLHQKALKMMNYRAANKVVQEEFVAYSDPIFHASYQGFSPAITSASQFYQTKKACPPNYPKCVSYHQVFNINEKISDSIVNSLSTNATSKKRNGQLTRLPTCIATIKNSKHLKRSIKLS
ncbi:hypothetical protein L0B53_18940 (plasmid) [Vibrio sp. SS-MA-C1-2]|uniref:hypothetical protein n=1 Tax=Vibrio sp. SS-MA-C1-2 TaxID=2908646 RepID=UPI001F43B5CF|nr:hypothetical protein [Vibrio sp. SS-MA-C1-2]UJF20213.1 hypothetical protein L0B53_18940 [Vibrio sp. SS-MA-C1-2]